MNPEIKQHLKDIVGWESFTDSLIDLMPILKHASSLSIGRKRLYGPPPQNRFLAILKLANQEKFPVIARGAGTALTGLVVPEQGGVILDMGRMNKIIEISIEDRLADGSAWRGVC